MSEPDTFLHLPTLFILVALGASIIRALSRGFPQRIRGRLPILLMAASLLLAALYGLATGNNSTSLPILYLAQTLLPLAAYFVGYVAESSATSIARALMIGTLLNTLIILSIAGNPLGGQSATLRVASHIPQFRNILPPLLVAGLIAAVAFRKSSSILPKATILSFLSILPLIWSRSALLSLFIGAAIAFWQVTRLPRNQRVVPSANGLRLMARTIGLLAGGILLYQVALVGVLGERVDRQIDDSPRIELAQEALDRILSRPLVGDAFHPVDATRAGGNAAAVEILFPSHNQYLDYGIRGGVIPAASFLVLILSSLWWSYQLTKSQSAEMARFGIAVLGILAGSAAGALFQTYFVQGTTASVLWFLMGYAARMSLTASSCLTSPHSPVQEAPFTLT